LKEHFHPYFIAGLATLQSIPEHRHTELSALFPKAALAGLIFASKVSGHNLSPHSLRAICGFLEASVAINDMYDEGIFDKKSYVDGVRKLLDASPQLGPFRFSIVQEVFSSLREMEINRPNPNTTLDPEAILSYRERTNLINIAGACAVAFHKPLSEYVQIDPDNISKVELQTTSPDWFQALHWSNMALVVVDDIAGKQGDIHAQRPSTYTAFDSTYKVEYPDEHNRNKKVVGDLKILFSKYCAKATNASTYYSLPVIGIAAGSFAFFPGIQQFCLENSLHIPGIVTEREIREYSNKN
jgi:hypothetical protein